LLPENKKKTPILWGGSITTRLPTMPQHDSKWKEPQQTTR
jgi:hypothetical protein